MTHSSEEPISTPGSGANDEGPIHGIANALGDTGDFVFFPMDHFDCQQYYCFGRTFDSVTFVPKSSGKNITKLIEERTLEGLRSIAKEPSLVLDMDEGAHFWWGDDARESLARVLEGRSPAPDLHFDIGVLIQEALSLVIDEEVYGENPDASLDVVHLAAVSYVEWMEGTSILDSESAFNVTDPSGAHRGLPLVDSWTVAPRWVNHDGVPAIQVPDWNPNTSR